MNHDNLNAMSALVTAVAQHDVSAAQRLAALAVARAWRDGGATTRLGDYAGFTSAEVKGLDGRWLVITPLFDWAPAEEWMVEEDYEPGKWEYAVRDAQGSLMARPDGDDTYGCTDIWFQENHDLDLVAGAADHSMQQLLQELLEWAPAVGESNHHRHLVAGELASSYATDPYPGERPTGSYAIDKDQRCWPVSVDEAVPSGFRVDTATGSQCLDAWLVAQGVTPLAGRVPLLGYGSNPCPAKVIRNSTPLPAVSLAANMYDLASVWCVNTTSRGHTPATVTAAPGHIESVFVMMVDQAELERLDAVEGRQGRYYDMVLLDEGRVEFANGARVRHPVAYVGGPEHRAPATVEGVPLLRTLLEYDEVTRLRRTVTVESGEVTPLGRMVPVGTYPHPGACVPDVFVYGTLMPGQSRWSVLAPHVTTEPVVATVRGQLRDTGFGYPALSCSATASAPGISVQMASVHAEVLLHDLDTIEGVASGLFSRQLRKVDDIATWVYVAASVAGLGTPISSWTSVRTPSGENSPEGNLLPDPVS